MEKSKEQLSETEENPVHSRFSGASWYRHPVSAIIGGAGGIGSWLTLFLARQGHDLHVYDFDNVEQHNIGGQLYNVDSILQSKVDAISEICRVFAGHRVSTYNEKYGKDSIADSVMFSCFDNMEARQVMFDNWIAAQRERLPSGMPLQKDCIFIDGRLNAETAEFFCVTDEESAQKWRESWFPDFKVEDAPCAYKATSHCAAILAGMMTAALNNFIANQKEGEQREIPFKTSIWLPTMMVLSE